MNEILYRIICKLFSDGLYAYSQHSFFHKDFMIQFDDEYYLVTPTDIKVVDYDYFNKFITKLKLSFYICSDNEQRIIDTLDDRFKIKSMFPEFAL